MLELLAVASIWLAQASGITLDFGGAVPRHVTVATTGVWQAGGRATFHNGAASRMTVRFTLPGGASGWRLRVRDRGSSTAGAPIYVRPVISVNGSVVSSDVVLGSVDRSRVFAAAFRRGANRIDITLGADSQSYYQLRSLHVGP